MFNVVVMVQVTTLLDYLNKVVELPERDTNKPLRVPISGIYKIKGAHTALCSFECEAAAGLTPRVKLLQEQFALICPLCKAQLHMYATMHAPAGTD